MATDKRAADAAEKVLKARNRREEKVIPLLTAKGWKANRWVIEAGKESGQEMTPDVAYDYLADHFLNGQTNWRWRRSSTSKNCPTKK
jgi:hypothetical protein